MAQRRMFNKSITNSSAFLKMPSSSRLLYYDLGMNADDDGYVEHFMVLRMTGATQQDLGVLELNGLVKIFDDNVLWIKDWKENNYIRNDRYTPSKYLSVYSVDTIGIPEVSTGKDRLGKVSIGNNIFKPPTLEEITEYCNQRNNNIDPKVFYDYFNVSNWVDSKGNKVKNWKQKIITWEKNTNSKKKIADVPSWLDMDLSPKEDKLTKEEQEWLDGFEKNNR